MYAFCIGKETHFGLFLVVQSCVYLALIFGIWVVGLPLSFGTDGKNVTEIDLKIIFNNLYIYCKQSYNQKS